MAKTDFQDVDEYIAAFPRPQQSVLKKIRRAIQEAVPQAEEVISYQVPAYKFHGWIVYFSMHKAHVSISCPPPFTVFQKFEKELARYEVSKSAIRFPLDEPVPIRLIAKIATFRAQENLARATQ